MHDDTLYVFYIDHDWPAKFEKVDRCLYATIDLKSYNGYRMKVSLHMMFLPIKHLYYRKIFIKNKYRDGQNTNDTHYTINFNLSVYM